MIKLNSSEETVAFIESQNKKSKTNRLPAFGVSIFDACSSVQWYVAFPFNIFGPIETHFHQKLTNMNDRFSL